MGWERVSCTHCGLPFRVAKGRPGEVVFCCTGCAVAWRLGTGGAGGGGGLKASWLAGVLGTGFLVVNQGLAAGLAALAERTGEGGLTAGQWAVVSWVLGVAGWVGLGWVQRASGAAGRWDRGVWVAGGAGLLGAIWLGGPGWGWVVNGVVAGWALRGIKKPAAKGRF